ncbi:MAG: right-handed parallel beta-helix repeat-containing protein [Calditrichota bacterium]
MFRAFICNRHLFVLACFVLVLLWGQAHAFDVGGWFYDPMMLAHYASGNCTWEQKKANIQTCNRDFLNWCDDLGLRWLCVEYPSADCFEQLAGANTNVKIVNTAARGLPRSAARYVHAISRTIWDTRETDWYYFDDIRVEEGRFFNPAGYSQSPHQIFFTDGVARDMWAPTCAGSWNGWDADYYQGYSRHMPMHFRVTCAVTTDPNHISDTTVAKIYWLRALGTGWCPSEIDAGVQWIRYPAMEIRWDSLVSSGPENLKTLEFTVYTHPDSGNCFDLLDNQFQLITSCYSQNDAFSRADLFARLSVEYQGYHTFYLEKVEVCDDDYFRLAWASDNVRSVVREDSILAALQAEMSIAGHNHGGWCADDLGGGSARALAKVIGITQEENVPWISSCYNDAPAKFFGYVREEAGEIPVQANETYLFGRDSTCRPNHWYMYPLDAMKTDSASERTYLSLRDPENECYPCIGESPESIRFDGSMSLQCALDFGVWGQSSALLDIIEEIDADYRTRFERFSEGDTVDNRYGLLQLTQRAHDQGAEAWPFLLSGQNSNETNCCDHYYTCGASWYPWRDPTFNEIKLSAWLVVASDADGIMWYGTLATTNFPGDRYYLNGLFNWGTGPDPDHSAARGDFCVTKSVYRTPRYWAAKEVLDNIYRIAPVIEQLDFERSYASRAFEMNYGESDSAWVARDNLYDYDRGGTPCTSYVSYIKACKEGIPAKSWNLEAPSATYVQVSRFMNPGTQDEDYYFLIVNRRGLANERRQIHIGIDSVEHPELAYRVETLIAGASYLADTTYSCYERDIEVELDPGDAELVHFTLADTSDWIITSPQMIMAPKSYAKNIIVRDGGSLTIIPDTSALRRQILRNGQWVSCWDSVAVITFWEGKGITFEAAGYNNSLQVLGSDSIRIRFQPANAEKPWSGIKITECAQNMIDFDNVIIQGATTGLMVEGGYDSVGYWVTPYVELDDCVIRDCDVGLSITSQAHVRVQNSDIMDNHDGVWAVNSVLRMDTCRIMKNERRGIFLGEGADGQFVYDSLSENGTDYMDAPIVASIGEDPLGTVDAALAIVNASRADFKRCYIGDNYQKGIVCFNSTLTMADPGSASPRWGKNKVIHNNNDNAQIIAYSSVIVLENGNNCIYGSETTESFWINASNITGCPRYWTNNYWGTTDTSVICDHLPPDVGFWPILFDEDGTVQAESEDEIVTTFIMAKSNVQDNQLDSALIRFKEVVSVADVCPIGRSAIREIIATDIVAGTSDESVDFFRTLADTSTIRATRIEARLAQAWSQAYSAQLDSSAMLMQDLLDSAATDTERVQILIERMTLDLLQQSADSSDEVTFDELKSVVDSIDYLLLSLNVWTETDIYDTVVMYAPCKVEETVLIHPGGRLEVKPYPGITWAEVTMENGSMLDADGMNPLLPRGAVIVEGTASCPVIIRSDSGWTPIFSPGGLVEMKHARLFGESVATEVYGNGHIPIIHIDSCEFSLFTDGLWMWNTDSTSYIRNSEFHDMGEGEYFGTEFGACILLIDNAHLAIENCNIHNGEGIGILNYYGSTALVQNTTITDCDNYGILNWEGSNLSMECCALTDNGDTLPELWSTDGLVDLVGSHNEFSDSLGTLLYSADPSYVDLEDGECYFYLRAENGLYLKSGDTTDIWDVTLNTWNPAIPTDSNFYDFLYPSNSVKWTVDSSLVDYIACGEEGGAAAISGGSSFLVIEDGEAGSYSLPQTGYEDAAKNNSDGRTKTLSNTENPENTAARSQMETSHAITKRISQRQLYRERHHREREQWRQIKELSSSEDRSAIAEATKKFVSDNPASDIIPAALVKLSGLAGIESKNLRISEFLREHEKSLTDPAIRTLARRLSYVSLAKEGNPREALSGLEEMMETADTPRDSIQALVSAMGVYFFDNPDRKVQPRNAAVRNNDVRQLVKRVIQLARVLDDPNLAAHHPRSAVPTEYCLYQNYPNPFNPNTEIRFDLPEITRVELKVFNILGQEVAKLADEVRPAGAYKILWDSKTSTGIPVASGVYVYQLKAGNFSDSKKMILLR